MTKHTVMATVIFLTRMVATHHPYGLAAEAAPPGAGSLVLALDGTGAETDARGGVSTWRNQAPGGTHDAVQTDPERRPLLDTANTLNGHPVLQFDGVTGDSADELVVTGLPLSGETTVFIVTRCGHQTRGGSQLRPILTLGWPESTLSVGPIQGGPSTDLRYDFAGAHTVARLGYLADGVYRIISAVGGSGYGRMALYVNGIRETGATVSQPPQRYGDVVIGGHAGHAVRHFRGEVAEVLVYDAALSDDQRHSVESYLGDKYGLPVAPRPRGPAALYVATDDPNASDRNPGTREAPFKTLHWAGQVARAGDRVSVRGGTYRETLRPANSGTAGQRIVFQAYADEQVIVDGSEIVSADAWKRVEGSQNVYEVDLNEALPPGSRTPGGGAIAYVFVDGENLPPCRVEEDGKVVSRMPSDDDVNTWHYHGSPRRLTVNLGADRRPAERRVEVTVRFAGINISNRRYITVRGFHVRRANFAGIAARDSSDVDIADCAIEYGHNTGISMAGARNGYVHRNFIRYTGGTSIHANGARDLEIAENVAYAWHTNPHGRMSGYHKVAYTVFGGRYLAHYHNLAIMPPGWTYKGGGFWTDTLGLGHVYIGNATRHTWNSGYYIESPADNNLVKWNTVTRFRHQGLYLRSNRHNLVAENYVAHGGTGLLLRHTQHERVAHNLFSHNWVQNVGTAINVEPQPGGERIQTLNYFNRNVYDVSSRPFVASWANNRYESLEAFQEATGQEAYGRVSAFHTDDLGMAYVLVDEPEVRDDPIPMFANPSLERPMAGDRTRGPFFWRGGDGEGYGDFHTWGRPGGQRYPFRGFHNQRARGSTPEMTCGNRWINVNDVPGTSVGGTVFEAYSLVDTPASARGVGLWSPSLPIAGGAEVDVSFWLRAADVEPVSEEGGIVVYFEWSDWTGQNQSRGYVIGGEDGNIARPHFNAGTYDWAHVTATVPAPDYARRMALYFGVRSTHGVMSLDGIETLRQRPARPAQVGEAPETTEEEASVPHVIPVEALTFHTVDLSGVVNRSLRDEEAGDGEGGWTDEGPGNDMEGLPTGRQVQEGVPFELLTPKTCVVLRSTRRPAGNLPLSVSIPVEARAEVLNFLHTGAWVGDRGTQWMYTVHYRDDSSVAVPVNSGLQVRDWTEAGNTDPFPQQAGRRVTVWPEKVGNRLSPECGLYWFQWQNPHPDREIRAITMETVNEDCVPILLAITRGVKDG